MPDLILNTLLGLWTILCEMAPYLLFGFLVAGLLSVLIPTRMVERHLGGKGIWPVVKAAAFGVPLPLCSCGVIPVAAGLRKHGATRGATTAFLLSTPQTGVDSILVTYSLLGTVYAVFRPVAALVTGVIGGWLVTLFDSRNGNGEAPATQCEDECCATGRKRPWPFRVVHYGFVTLPRDIAGPLLLGLLAAGLISAIVPKDYFAQYLGTGIVAMIVMMLVGIPIYVCATASVPIAAALIAKGVSPGAALCFLITGPATNAATITTIWKIMGRRTVAIYLGTVALGALGSGILLDLIYKGTGKLAEAHIHEGQPGLIGVASAAVLLGVLAAALVPPGVLRLRRRRAEAVEQMVHLAIKGMTCEHCVQSVTRALRACPGVASAQVDLKTGQAEVTGTALDPATLCRAVEEAGFMAAVASAPNTATSS